MMMTPILLLPWLKHMRSFINCEKKTIAAPEEELSMWNVYQNDIFPNNTAEFE